MIEVQGLPAWSSETPTEPGEYWFCKNGEEECEYVRLQENPYGGGIFDGVYCRDKSKGTWKRVVKPPPPGKM